VEDREVLADDRRRQEVGVPGEGADDKGVAVDADLGEIAEVVDVYQRVGPGQTQLHHRDEAVAAGYDPRFGTVSLQ
jgi:hypothetical protein